MKNTLIALAVVAGLSACGGGSGGGPAGNAAAPVQQEASIPLRAAYRSAIETPRSGNLVVSGTAVESGSPATASGSGSYREASAPSTFEGRAAVRQEVNASVTVQTAAEGRASPAQTVTSAGVVYLDAATARLLGSTGENSHCVVDGQAPDLPETVPVATDASYRPWFSKSCWANSGKAGTPATVSGSYKVEREGATTVLFRVRETSSASDHVTTTYRVTTTGAVTKVSEALEAASGSDHLDLAIRYQ